MFDLSTHVLFRKRITVEILMEANEYLLVHKNDNTPPSAGGSGTPCVAKEDGNKGTLTLDATCAPVNIRYQQEISPLNEAREKLETIIYHFCKSYGLPLPRRYRRRARRDYLAFAKSRKHSAEKIRKALRKQLGYVGRDIRPIVRRKDKVRTGYYPEHVLADQIYRTRENRNYCDHGIRISGPKLGRPGVNTKTDKKQEYQDNSDRIEVKRTCSLRKRCYGIGFIVTKLEETQLTFIALSVFVTNLCKIQKRIFYTLLYLFQYGEGYKRRSMQIFA